MKCRAKMCDGSPVTFEFIDQGGLKYRRIPEGPEGVQSCAPYISEMIGDGFYVRSEWRGQTIEGRLEYDRLALERSGVDTATVERLNGEGPRPGGVWSPWVRLFPPKREDTSFLEVISEPMLRSEDQDKLLKSWESAMAAKLEILQRLEAILASERGVLAEAATKMPGVPSTPTADMLDAGAASLKDCIVTDAMIHGGMLWFIDPLKVVASIWAAMEKARK